MSVDSADETRIGVHKLEEALIAHCRLSPDQVVRTMHARRSQQLDFVEAAIQLGFITRVEADRALAWAKLLLTSGDAGVVETALRRRQINDTGEQKPPVIVTPSDGLIFAHDQNNPRGERLRSLRTELMLLTEPSRYANPVAVLSPCAREGRSQLAAELAIAFSQLGRRTLLIDADLRRPRQHLLFCAANDAGLSLMLRSGESTQPYDVAGLPNLSLYTSGPAVPNPLEMLSDGNFERLLMGWRDSYEFILIDTPSVSEFADGLLLASLARRVLALSRANITPHRAMKEMLRRLSSTQSRILGAVLSHF